LITAVQNHKIDPTTYDFVTSLRFAREPHPLRREQGEFTTRSYRHLLRATAAGTYPVYERFLSTTMSGTTPTVALQRPDIQWVSYFNGGDALHEFRATPTDSPEPRLCRDALRERETVFPYTPIGTLVTVNP